MLTDGIRPEIRVGISLGEVIVADGTLTGAGVVLAQRLEQLAEPNGVVVQGSVTETVPSRFPFGYRNLGEQTLKGFEHPVRAFRAELAAGKEVPPPDSVSPGVGAPPISGASELQRRMEPPDQPSIAVLPFNNVSGDAEQEYFADGITEDIITDISKIPGLFVIARNSSFTFKKQSVDVKEVGRELGVRHVLEGSVRKAGKKVRINIQLIDARTGGHVWADRYDRDLEDIFVLQDEVTQKVVETLKVTLAGGERGRREERGKVNTEAYDCLIRGRSCLLQFNAEAFIEARAMLERALEIDPGLTQSYGYRAIASVVEYLNGWNGATADHLEQAMALARRGCGANEFDVISHNALAVSLMWLRMLDKAEVAARRTIEIDNNFAEAHGALGNILHFSGNHELAIESFERALRLDPEFHVWIHGLGRVYFTLEQYDKAEATFKRRLIHMPRSDVTRAYLASLYGHTSRIQDARRTWRELMEINPEYTIGHSLRILPYTNPAPLEAFVGGLRKAGLTQ